MDKVLLIFDEYSQMIQLETMIRKLGFDAIGITNEMSMSDQIVTFNPDIILVHGKGQKVSSVRVAQKLREMLRWQGKVLLILQQGQKINPEDLATMRMDLVLEAPYEMEKIVQILARFGGLDEESLVQKFQNQKSAHQDEKKDERKEFMLITDSEEPTRQHFKLKNEQESDSIRVGQFDLERKKDNPKKNESKGWSLKQTEPLSRREIDEEFASSQDKKWVGSAEALDADGETQFVGGVANPAEQQANETRDFALPEQVDPRFEQNSLGPEGDDVHGVYGLEPEVDVSRHVKGSSVVPEKRTPYERLKQEIQEVEQTERTRVSKYAKFLKGLALKPQSSLNRRATRSVQNDLMLDINVSELEDQDEIRREFTRALFKKNR